jgi:hypothetical protein
MQTVCSYAFPMGLHVLNCLLTRELLDGADRVASAAIEKVKRRTS